MSTKATGFESSATRIIKVPKHLESLYLELQNVCTA